MPHSPRRAAIIADIIDRTGIDGDMIERLVHTFYARIREDALLGPVFAEWIDDWQRHLDRMCLFWSSVTLMSGHYHGRPMPAHQPLPVDARHFDRWLELFEQTANDVCPPAAAAHFVDAARRIARSLEFGVAEYHGVLLCRGERLSRRDDEVSLPGNVPESRSAQG